MHRVVKAHLGDFKDRYGINLPDDRAFEAFVNFSILRSYSTDSVDVESLIYEGADPGIDGLMFFVDDIYLSANDELDDLFQKKKRDLDVHIVMTQSKTSEGWDKKEINNFSAGVIDFLAEHAEFPHSDYLAERKEIFNNIIKNVGKIRGGKPNIYCYFATSGRDPEEVEIKAAFSALENNLNSTGLFSGVKAEPLNRDALITLWTHVDGPVEATLPVFANAPFPKSPDIEESYVVTVKAADFVNELLSDENGNLRKSIFEENVRDFIGGDAEVNSEISETLEDGLKQKRFGILNNGITLVSPDVRVQGNDVYLRDFQIVNGCQTSNLLYELREQLSDDVNVMLKIIETANAEIVDDIVRATNRQTKVQDAQFLATLDAVKGIENYFIARGSDEDHRLFFERRQHQFASEDIPAAIRVFDIREIARCAGAMFFDRPDLASRYPNRLTGEMKDLVFGSDNVEEIYYTAAFASYRLRLHFSNQRIDKKYQKVKWHILMAIKYYLSNGSAPKGNSRKIRTLCDKVYAFMEKTDDEVIKSIKKICEIFDPIEELTRDRIKGQQYVQEIRTKAIGIGGQKS